MKTGDIVRFLNVTGGGRVVRIDGNMAYVEDEDGFEVPALVRECVVVGHAEEKTKGVPVANEAAAAAKAAPAPSSAPLMQPQPKGTPEEEPLSVEETEHGDKINVVLAFEAVDIKRLSSTPFEATIVNDSNYYINFVFATRSDSTSGWTLRRASTVEPNIMLSLGQFEASDLNDMELMMFQYTAYKDAREFEAKHPGSVELRLDTTKFFKLHCFRESVYFEQPVIEFELVKDDRPWRPITIDHRQLQQAIKEKRAAERPAVRPVKKHIPKGDGVLEVDLHINELVDNTAGLSRADMLNLQVDEFRRVMDANLHNHGRKIVFIHGKGEGILRQALLKELNYRYKGHDVCDASFREYGFGATQVTIR